MRLYGFAKLTDEQLQSVQDLEQETGKRLLVYRPFEAAPADLTPAQVEQLQSLEAELGNVIGAIE